MEMNSPPDERQRQADLRRERGEAQPQTDRRRSRSPPVERAKDDILPPHDLFSGRQSESASSSDSPWRDEIEEVRPRYRYRDWTPDPEVERYRNLPPMERLKEDGQKLQANILADPMVVVSLEVSKSMKAMCRAGDDCVAVQAKHPRGTTIEDELRIRVDGANRLPIILRAGPTAFYHFPCFTVMVDLKALLPAQFQLSADTCWGLLPRKWLEHKGCINVNKIAAYIKAIKEHDKEQREFSSAWFKWNDVHKECGESAECACPAAPVPPKKPTLENYTTGKSSCILFKLYKHSNFWDMQERYVMSPRGFVKVGEEIDPVSIMFGTNSSQGADHAADD